MPSITSMDLRERIVAQYKKGYSQNRIANNLMVSQSTVSRILKRYDETGSVKPSPIPGSRSRAVIQPSDHPAVIEYVLKYPDLTLKEYCEGLSEHLGKPITSVSHLCECLNALGLKRKKNQSGVRAVTRVRAAGATSIY
jgi:transposase